MIECLEIVFLLWLLQAMRVSACKTLQIQPPSTTAADIPARPAVRRQQQSLLLLPDTCRGGGRPKKNSLASAASEGFRNSLASGLAAACSKTILAPFDTIKTVQQQARQGMGGKGLSFVDAAALVVSRPKGIFELYAGLGVAAIGAMPSVGLYFGIYSYSKRIITPRLRQAVGLTREKSFVMSDNAARRIGIAASAAIGNTFASFSRVPYEVVKQQLQTGQYPNTRKALTAMFRSKGMRAFFPLGGVSIQMVRDIPYAIMTLLTYEAIQEKWTEKSQLQHQGWKDMASGAIAGGVGSFLTNPMDVGEFFFLSANVLYSRAKVLPIFVSN